jgi:hypothetical protein
MCESLERKSITHDLPYDLEERGDKSDITRGLMRLSQQALSQYGDMEHDIYSYENVLQAIDFHPSMSEAKASWGCLMKMY